MGKPKFPARKKPAGSPLTWNQHTGYYVAKVGKKTKHFGKRGGTHKDAIAIFNRDIRHLLAGNDPADFNTDGYTIRDLCNDFIEDKQEKVGELTYRDYIQACDYIVEAFDKRRLVSSLIPEDFKRLRKKISKKKTRGKGDVSPTTLNNRIRNIKIAFKWAYDDTKLEAPVKYGNQFKQASKRELRLYRASLPSKLYEVAHLKTVIKAAKEKPQFKAMILLAINCGFSNVDISKMRFDKIELGSRGGWHNSERFKTGSSRRCWLWPETVKAIKEWLTEREKEQTARLQNNPKLAEVFENNADLVFLTRNGKAWERSLSAQYKKLSPPASLSFRHFRHSFRTIAGESLDREAVNYIMGHEPPGDEGETKYNQRIADKRLKAVSKLVHKHYKTALS